MKKIIIILGTIAVVGLMVGFNTMTVNAFDLQSHYEKMKAKREQAEKEIVHIEFLLGTSLNILLTDGLMTN